MFKLNRLGIMLLLSLGGAAVAILYGVYDDYKVSGFDAKYIYESDSLLSNPVFYIRNVDYKKDYQEFLNRKNNRDTLIPVDFPLYSLPSGDKIYLIKNIRDKDLVAFYDPNYRRIFDGFITGYIYVGYIHDSLPPNGE